MDYNEFYLAEYLIEIKNRTDDNRYDEYVRIYNYYIKALDFIGIFKGVAEFCWPNIGTREFDNALFGQEFVEQRIPRLDFIFNGGEFGIVMTSTHIIFHKIWIADDGYFSYTDTTFEEVFNNAQDEVKTRLAFYLEIFTKSYIY